MNYKYNLNLFQASPSVQPDLYKTLFPSAWKENSYLAAENLFFTGDIHHGKACSALFDAGLDWMCSSEPEQVNKLAQMIPEYGDWNNLLVLMHYESTRKEAVHLFLGRINADINLIQERRPSSSFSKCMPEGESEEGRKLAAAFHLSIANYDSLIRTLREKSDAAVIASDFQEDWTKMDEQQMLLHLARYNRIRERMHMR